MTESGKKRVPPSKTVESEVLWASRRRCCLCYFLNDVKQVQKGQIAHLNQDRSNSAFENLVYLCLNHHDEYDSRPSQSKGYTVQEVKRYRDDLYNKLGTINTNFPQHLSITIPTSKTKFPGIPKDKNSKHLNLIQKPWKLIGQVEREPLLFAYKSPNRFDGICRIERIDLPDKSKLLGKVRDRKKKLCLW